MGKLLAIVAILFGLSATANAHHKCGGLVNVKHADKILVKAGVSHHKLMGMMHCLLTIKKHGSEEKALEAAKEKVKAFCENYGLSDEKCTKKQMKKAKMIHNCFAKAEFFKDFIHANISKDESMPLVKIKVDEEKPDSEAKAE